MTQENMMDIAAELLTQYEGASDQIEARTGFPQIPDGRGVLRIKDMYLERSSGKKRLQLTAVCELLSHDEDATFESKEPKATYSKSWGLDKAESLSWIAGDFANLGMPLPSVTIDLIKRVIEITEKQLMLGWCFEVTFKNKDPKYAAVSYINAGARREDLESAVGNTNTAEARF